MAAGQVLFASRIPTNLKERMSRFCAGHGMRINFLVSEAIQEKLDRLAQDEADVALIHARKKGVDFASSKEMDAYFKKRFAKR